ncbi:MAG: NAD(P)/FAD-dependent oxidoreductase, partial [Acidimicrobiales bacterium]
FLYQVATALLEPTGAAHPVRSLVRGLPNVDFRLAEVTGVDLTRRVLRTDRGEVPYDYLVLAAGAVNDYFGHPDLAAHTFALGDLGEALALRNHVLASFEAAAWATDPGERSRLLHVVVVGGGPTGVELSAALAVLFRQLAGGDFPTIGPEEVRLTLVEGSGEPLPSFAPDSQAAAERSLRRKGVRVESGSEVTAADELGVTLADGRRIEARTVVWAAGVRASPLAGTLPATGSHHRAIVGASLQVERHPEVFVVGDMAQIPGTAGALPMVAQVAIQSGRRAARSILALAGGGEARPFGYRDLGAMAALGRGDAVAEVGAVHLQGLPGWAAWLGLHIARTVGLQARATVLLDWASGFLFADRPVRLITGPERQAVRGTVSSSSSSSGGEPAVTAAPVPHARADLPSVSVANANRWGRTAALAWWSQSYPGLRPEPERRRGLGALRARATRLRQALTGEKSKTEDWTRG